MVLLILATSYFVAAEFALIAVDRDRIEALVERGSRRAKLAAWALRHLSFNLSGAQLGITVTSLVLGFIAEPTVAEAIAPALGFLPDGAVTGVSVAIALLIVTVATMVVGELVPKGIAVAEPVRVTLALAPAIKVFGTVVGPLIRLLNGAADWTVRRLGIEPREELRAVRTIDELELLITSSGEEGTLEPEAFHLLTRTLRFAHKTAGDALVPRVDLATLPANATVADLVRASLDTGYSRFPVMGEGPDDVLGLAHAKDALRFPPEVRGDTPIAELVRPATFIPEGRDLESLLTEMRAQVVQLAVVVDEYGGVAGIVTLEDLLEEIVGEIEDEHDPAASLTSPLPWGAQVVDGSLHLDDAEDATGMTIPEGPYETLAGFVLAQLGHLPEPGEQVVYEGWLLEVVEMDRRRIDTVRVTPPPGGAP